MKLQSRGARVLRGIVVALSSVVIAALSHMAGGGAAPGGLGTGLAVGFAVLVCIALAGRRLSGLRLSIAVGLSQIVFHTLFSLGAVIPEAGGHSVGMLGMVMSGGHETTLPSLSSPHAVALAEIDGARMWFGHIVAAVLTIALLLHGERALFTLVRVTTGRLSVLVRSCAILPYALRAPRHTAVSAIADRRGLRGLLDILLSARPHRGPPQVV